MIALYNSQCRFISYTSILQTEIKNVTIKATKKHRRNSLYLVAKRNSENLHFYTHLYIKRC